jgi:hypothetical protein
MDETLLRTYCLRGIELEVWRKGHGVHRMIMRTAKGDDTTRRKQRDKISA